MPEPSFRPFRLFPLLAGGLLVLSGDGAIGSDCAWTPQEATLVFMSSRDGNADICSVAGDLSRWTNLTSSPASENWPEWSPDGQQITFASWRREPGDTGEESAIVVINTDGSGRRTVVSGGQNWYPRWSPDGRWLVYTAQVPGGMDGDLDLYAVPVDGDPTPARLTGSPAREAEGQWQPVPACVVGPPAPR